MITFQYFETMERYARGGMNDRERAEFELQLRENKELAAEWADYLLIARSVRNSLRSKSGSNTSHIPQLVSDARDLAKENGLLLTDEDIWLYHRKQLNAESKTILEKRRQNDALFDAMVDRESAIIEGIRKNAAKARLIQQVRDSLHEQGFTSSLHEQILKDMEAEQKFQPGQKPSTPPKKNSNWSLIIIAVLIAALSALFWWINRTNPNQALLDQEIAFLKTELLQMTSLNTPNSSRALKMVANNLPDGALAVISTIAPAKKTPDILLIEGIAYFEKNDFKSAITAFNGINASAGNEIHLKALWLTAVSQVALTQNEECKATIKRLTELYGATTPTPREVSAAAMLLKKN